MITSPKSFSIIMKKILIIHNRAYHCSGPETYLQNLSLLLRANHISYDIYALNYAANDFSNLCSDLPGPIGSKLQYSFKHQNLGLLDKARLFFSSIFNISVSLKLFRVLNNNQYDFVVILQYLGKLSPSILLPIWLHKIPVTIRQSDFAGLCINNTLFRNDKDCFLCVANPSSLLRFNCGTKSLTSLHYFILLRVNNLLLRLCNPSIMWTNTNSYLIGKNSAAYSYLHNYICYTHCSALPQRIHFSEKRFDFIYFGRITKDKGCDVIFDLILNKRLPYSFIFVGDIDESLVGYKTRLLHANVTFVQKVSSERLHKLILLAKFSILSSTWIDNLPNSLIEAYCFSLPCIMPNHGCFPEFSVDSRLLYDRVSEIESCIKYCAKLSLKQYDELSIAVSHLYENKFSPAIHMQTLREEYSRLLQSYRRA